MKVDTECSGDGRAITLVVLMIAVFTVSIGYSVVLPRAPPLIERLLGAGVQASQVSLHTGLLTAIYTAFFVASAVVLFVPSREGRARYETKDASLDKSTWLLSKLLFLTFIVSTSVGIFEVGLALRGIKELGLAPYQIALMFSECSLVMFMMQAIVFSPWFKPDMTRWLIAPALAILAVGLFLVPRATNFTLMMVVIGAIVASVGILSPILTYSISVKVAQAWELGKQTAASLGITVGSAASGILFNTFSYPGASSILAAGLTTLGFLLSLGLPYLLMLPHQQSHPT